MKITTVHWVILESAFVLEEEYAMLVYKVGHLKKVMRLHNFHMIFN